MTLWQSGGLAFGYLVCAVAWFRGGRPERFAAGVLVLGGLLAGPANAWRVGGVFPLWLALDGGSLLIFVWLAFRSDRWWPMVAASSYGLIVLAQAIRLTDPTFSHYAMVSAHVGLGYVTDLSLLFGVWERWLAGEQPRGPAAWATAQRLTAARRQREPYGPDQPAGRRNP
ncbi:hypothetical protein [Brevundimonas sp.]|uniref:hypothetical protein n=1 Tax=Brevundimonas sp. TaxID=1871086 RepID=UPI002EDB5E1A